MAPECPKCAFAGSENYAGIVVLWDEELSAIGYA